MINFPIKRKGVGVGVGVRRMAVSVEMLISRTKGLMEQSKNNVWMDKTISVDDILLLGGMGLLIYHMHDKDSQGEKRISDTIKFTEEFKNKIFGLYTQGAINYATLRIRDAVKNLIEPCNVNIFILGSLLIRSKPYIQWQLKPMVRSLDEGIKRYFEWSKKSKKNYKLHRETSIACDNIYNQLVGERQITRAEYEERKLKRRERWGI
jgi:hypothetical protein